MAWRSCHAWSAVEWSAVEWCKDKTTWCACMFSIISCYVMLCCVVVRFSMLHLNSSVGGHLCACLWLRVQVRVCDRMCECVYVCSNVWEEEVQIGMQVEEDGDGIIVSLQILEIFDTVEASMTTPHDQHRGIWACCVHPNPIQPHSPAWESSSQMSEYREMNRHHFLWNIVINENERSKEN